MMRATDMLIPPRWSPPARPAVTQGLSTRAVAGMKDASGNIIRPDTDGGAVSPVILPPSLPEAPRIEDILVRAPDGWLKGWSIAAEAIVADHISAGAIETTHLAAGAVTAEKIAAGAITTEKIDAGAITAEKIAAGAITAEMLDVEELSALSADLGTITAGIITNPAGTALINMNATGTQAALRFGAVQEDNATLLIQANGNMRIGAAPGGNGQYIAINPSIGRVTLNDVNLVAPSGTLGQLEIAAGGHIQSSDYVPGTSGWRLDNNGVEANNGIFRGRIDGGLVTTGGIQFAIDPEAVIAGVTIRATGLGLDINMEPVVGAGAAVSTNGIFAAGEFRAGLGGGGFVQAGIAFSSNGLDIIVEGARQFGIPVGTVRFFHDAPEVDDLDSLITALAGMGLIVDAR